MIIQKIILENFRIYHGVNELNLGVDRDHTISIISGNNGFGKTSLLTALVWCLYGKLMTDVDERYRREIYESGGYKFYCMKIMNRLTLSDSDRTTPQLELDFENADFDIQAEIEKNINSLGSFSVTIQLEDISIPSISCTNVQIKRTHHILSGQETLEITIDGRINELTKEVGSEIFINDFILPREIARFFFFDAEKIVSLAEMRSVEDKRNISQAYSEVLGIKKYLDLKENLENLRLRLRKKSSDTADRQRLEKLRKQIEQNEKITTHCEGKIREREDELLLKRQASDRLQEKLIREGSAITVEQLKEYRTLQEHLADDGTRIKNRLKDMIEIAPFAIAAGKISAVKRKLDEENISHQQEISEDFLKEKLTAIKKAIRQQKLEITASAEKQIMEIISSNLLSDGQKESKDLLHFSPEQYSRFLAIYENLQGTFNKSFRQLHAEFKKQQSSLNIVRRKLQDAESKGEDPVIKEIRKEKVHIDADIRRLEEEVINVKADKLHLQNEMNTLAKQVSELTKKVSVEELDRAKDEIASRLIEELTDFIHKLKIRKKASLEVGIQRELNRLMHKSTFVNRVEVKVEGELIDIELYDDRDQPVNTDTLSKGEQQLYATALLKALVDESNIRFPVFIDSPLQKLDKEHARNIIRDFYPNVAGQVVLFPLLEKELTEEEYQWLLPHVGNAYLINNIDQYHSQFQSVNPKELFSVYHQDKYVHEH